MVRLVKYSSIGAVIASMTSFRGSSITNRSFVPEDLLRMLERVIDRTQLGRCLTVRLNVPSIEEIKHGGVHGQPFLYNLNFTFISFNTKTAIHFLV